MGTLNYEELYSEIFRRKSVRRFESRETGKDLTDKINAAIAEALPLNSAPAALRILNADEAGVSFGKAPYCLGAYAGDGPEASLNAAFLLQEMSLRLSCLGLGSCWVGMARPKKALAEYKGLSFFKLIVFGYPAEELHRSGVGKFNRKSLGEISAIQGRDELLEAVRLAPSAMNRQGWYLAEESGRDGSEPGRGIRLFMAGNNFFLKKLMDSLTVADAGIALCHLWIAAQKSGVFLSACREEAVPAPKKNYAYVWTVKVKG
jgi:nitroreductase